MRSLTTSFAFLAMVCLLVGHGGSVYGVIKCYQSITDVPCPSLTASESCQVQYDATDDSKSPLFAVQKAACEKGVYHSRKSGQYGSGSCQSVATETGQKCVPETEPDGSVKRDECGEKYTCVYAGEGSCVKGNSIAGSKAYADVYKITTNGCQQPGGPLDPP